MAEARTENANARAGDQGMTKRLVLVGGGHAHLHVLREWRRRPMPGVELLLVSPSAQQWYSGMVPGFLAGRYEAGELRIDLAALARCAGATLVVTAAESVSAAERVVVAGGERIPFDVCSLDVGSGMAGAEIPGVREHAVALRPMENAVELRNRLDALLARGGSPLTVAIVGGGAAGVEVAFALEARMRRSSPGGRVMIVEGATEVLAGESPRMRRRATALLREREIGLVLGAPVTRVEAGTLVLGSGAQLPADLIVWATGSAPPALLATSDLPRDEAGYLLVDRKLRAAGGLPVWGAGDCVTIANRPQLARSGVQAVREGTVLLHNLRAALGSGRARRFHPRNVSLALLSTSDGRALARRGRLEGYGRWAWRLKERIDRRFVARFAVVCDERAVPAS
jgi:pyridine nucleotide-disulfide oxidoreductase family protein